MKFVKWSLLLIFVLLAITCTKQVDQAEFTVDKFKEQYRAIEDEVLVINLCKDFMEYSDDIDAVREAQSTWREMDEEGVKEFTTKLSDANKSSAKYLYLKGRVTESPVEQIKIGREVITLDPNWAYGYRLTLATYSQKLFNGESDNEFYNELEGMLAADAGLFTKVIEVDSTQTYTFQFLADYQIFTKDFNGLIETLNKGKALEQSWPSGFDYGIAYAGLGEFDGAKKAVEEEVDKKIAEGWPKENREAYIARYYSNALSTVGAFDEAIKFKKSKQGYAKDMGALYDLACTYSLKGDADQAFSFLNKAVKNGWDQVRHTNTDTDLKSLHDDSRWTGFVSKVEANWDSGKDNRKIEALSDKVSEDAPKWALEDVNGQIINIDDLKGNVIVLDFWATWCGPCRMAMPEIDAFVKEDAKENVKVFSINVWEKGKSKPAKFMTENNYNMILLYGSNDLAKEYGISGIPFLCVIDKEGKIRYRHTGYSDGLRENLNWWTDDLL